MQQSVCPSPFLRASLLLVDVSDDDMEFEDIFFSVAQVIPASTKLVSIILPSLTSQTAQDFFQRLVRTAEMEAQTGGLNIFHTHE